MQKRITIMRKRQMDEIKVRNSSCARVTLTKKIEQAEQQIIVTQGQAKQTQLVEGRLLSYQSSDQIFVHGGTSKELADTSIISTAHASLLITILLDGELKFGYDDLEFDLTTQHEPQGVVVNLTKPANFHRLIVVGNSVSKVNIVVKPQWIAARMGDCCSEKYFTDVHKAFYRLKLSKEIFQLAQTLIHTPTPTLFSERVNVESLTHQIISLALSQMPKGEPKNRPTAEHFAVTHRISEKIKGRCHTSSSQQLDTKLADIISYIETHLTDELGLEKLARKFSMSTSNLQRRFKQSYGLTINGYIRYRRLEIAYQHLERGFVSITEAAYEAGYQHPSNFTNAFKKAFGVPPHEIAKN